MPLIYRTQRIKHSLPYHKPGESISVPPSMRYILILSSKVRVAPSEQNLARVFHVSRPAKLILFAGYNRTTWF
jgi:hypothetical protein